ncbi:hypothetical protein HAX54_038480 [Datura stramonium]|uniref:Uncharacterized protein n=1 Tax=Datura stramonium TaxID=4076 RepID=A0ABS8VLJ9_DATST|nr:hypothetical protein [Datura stramonium]
MKTRPIISAFILSHPSNSSLWFFVHSRKEKQGKRCRSVKAVAEQPVAQPLRRQREDVRLKRKQQRRSSSCRAAAAAASSAADLVAPPTLLGPSLHVHWAFAEQNNKRIVLALQSGLKSELTWALNTLTLLSFKEKDEVRKDATPLAKFQGLLDALLQVTPRVRLLGAPAVTGFGNEYEALNSISSLPHPSTGSSNKEASVLKCANKLRPGAWSFEEDGLFNLDEEGRAEKQLCAVAASNIIRNFSNMPDNEVIMAQHRHCLETIFQCLEDYGLLCGKRFKFNLCTEWIFCFDPGEKRAVQALMGMLGSAVKAGTQRC